MLWPLFASMNTKPYCSSWCSSPTSFSTERRGRHVSLNLVRRPRLLPKLPRDLHHHPLVHIAGQQLAVLGVGARQRERRVPSNLTRGSGFAAKWWSTGMSAAPVEGHRYVEVTGGVAKVTDDILRVPEDFTALQLPAETEGGRRRRKVRPVGGEGADAARAGRVLPQCPPPPLPGPKNGPLRPKT